MWWRCRWEEGKKEERDARVVAGVVRRSSRIDAVPPLDEEDTLIRRHRRRRRPRRLGRRRCRRRVRSRTTVGPVEKAWRRRVRAPSHLVRRGRHASVEFHSPVRLYARSLVSLSTSSFTAAYHRVRLLRLSHPSVPHSPALPCRTTPRRRSRISILSADSSPCPPSRFAPPAYYRW
jgi:hypothetical protein